MGLLDQVIGGVVGQVLGGGRGQAGGLSPIVRALLMLLMARGAGGGLGDILGGGGHPGGGGHASPGDDGRRDPAPRDDGDLGGFGEAPRTAPSAGGGDFGDLSGMLDGPGDRASGERSPGAGPYAELDREPSPAPAGPAGGGLDGLIESFGRSGLGDVIGSWIGGGPNHAIAPHRLADALGPDTVETLSRQTGLARDDLLGQLAQALPGVIDGLTPQGRRPEPDDRHGW